MTLSKTEIKDILFGKLLDSSCEQSGKDLNRLDKYLGKLEVDVDEYKRIVYQLLGEVVKLTPLKQIVLIVKKKLVGWDSIEHDRVRNEIKEHDEYLAKPFEVSEGVLECTCGSKETISFQKQVRSSDEPMTTFAACCKCGRRWTHSD